MGMGFILTMHNMMLQSHSYSNTQIDTTLTETVTPDPCNCKKNMKSSNSSGINPDWFFGLVVVLVAIFCIALLIAYIQDRCAVRNARRRASKPKPFRLPPSPSPPNLTITFPKPALSRNERAVDCELNIIAFNQPHLDSSRAENFTVEYCERSKRNMITKQRSGVVVHQEWSPNIRKMVETPCNFCDLPPTYSSLA